MKKMDVLLSKLYYSPASATGYSRPVILWREAKKHIPKLTLKQVQEWYWGQDVPSRFQQAKKHFNRSLFLTRSVSFFFSPRSQINCTDPDLLQVKVTPSRMID